MDRAHWIALAVACVVVAAHVGLFVAFVRPSRKPRDGNDGEGREDSGEGS